MLRLGFLSCYIKSMFSTC